MKLTLWWRRQILNTQIIIQLENVKITRGYEIVQRGNMIWKIREGVLEEVSFELSSEG